MNKHHKRPAKFAPLYLNKFSIPILLFAFFLFPFLLTACSPVIGNTQPALSEWLTLAPGGTLGQTFVANYDGLSGIQIWLAPHIEGDGKLNVHLRDDPQSSTDLTNTNISISHITTEGMYSFYFDPQSSSRRKYFYISLNISGEGAVKAGAASGETYMDGARYQNTKSDDGQLSFRLIYSIRRLGLGLVREFAIWVAILLVGAFLFLVPGWGLLSLLWNKWDTLTWIEKTGLSAGVSIATYPIIFLWTWIVGLHLGPFYAWFPPIAGLIFLLWKWRAVLKRRSTIDRRIHMSVGFILRKLRRSFRRGVLLPNIVLLIVISFLVCTRFWAIRTLDAPMWGDSYQHTVIAQRIADNNGLFQSWQPYADLQTFTYHFGFHVNAVVFHWITGLAIPRAVLWVGQILNILAILCLYPLATKVCRNRWGSVLTLIIAGLLAPVPMIYTNWGRYTQLAGQIILIAVIYLLWITLYPPTSLESPSSSGTKQRDRGVITLTAILMGGLALTHFRVLVFTILFIVAIFLSNILYRIPKSQWKTSIIKVFWIGLGGGVIFLPWFINVLGGTIIRNLSYQLTTPASAVSTDIQSYNSIGSLLQYLPVSVWLLLPIAVAWGLWKQRKEIVLVCMWAFLLLIAANPAWLRLPGTGAISNFAVFIAIYIPASVLIGGAAGIMMEQYSSRELQIDPNLNKTEGWKAKLLRLGVVGVHKKARLSSWSGLIIALVLTGFSLVGVSQRLNDLHPERYSLLTRPDLRAVSWINDNLHPNATLLVNSFFAYGGSLVVGSDGGWWLPVLTKRQTTLPPLNYGTERGPQPDYKQWINALTMEIAEKGLTHPDVLSMLQERQITQVYIGQRQGRVNYYGPAVIDPLQLEEDTHFRVAYHQDRVWIFDVIHTP